MAIDKTFLLQTLKRITEALARLGVETCYLLGGTAIMMSYEYRATRDIDLKTDVDIAKIDEEVFEQFKRSIGAEDFHETPVCYKFHCKFQDTQEPVDVDILLETEMTAIITAAIEELGSFTVDKINKIELKSPTPEALLAMKIATAGDHRPQDYFDIDYLRSKANRSRVMAFCIDHGLEECFVRFLGNDRLVQLYKEYRTYDDERLVEIFCDEPVPPTHRDKALACALLKFRAHRH